MDGFVNRGIGMEGKREFLGIWLTLLTFCLLTGVVLLSWRQAASNIPEIVGRALTAAERAEVIARNSPLTSYVYLSANADFPREEAIEKITIHHMADDIPLERLGEVFAEEDRQASANYAVDGRGRVALYVEEANRAWTSSSPDNDHQAVTIEVASDTTHPYAITDKAMAALIELCADICRRNGIKKLLWKGDKNLVGKVDQQNLTVHRWFANKACPGDYIYQRLADIAAKVNAKLGASGTSPAPDAPVSKVPYKVRITATDLRIRQGPNTDATIVQKAIAPGVYTIVSEATGKGATLWGKLKSGLGWVSLDYCKKI